MEKAKLERMVIPKFPSEAAEAAWWDAHRAEVNVRILAKLLILPNALRMISTSAPMG
jgi:hypothetical protein